MGNDEPVLLYASNAASFSLLSWRPEASTESNYLAVPERDRRRKMKVGAGRQPEFDAEIRRAGGVWTRVEQSRDQCQMMVRVFPKNEYLPPNRMFVLGAGGKIDPRYIGNDPMNLKPQEYALLPVDLASEKQLEKWLDGLKGLPGDLCEATLQNIVNEGLVSSRRPPQFAGADDPLSFVKEEPRSGVPGWVWAVVTGILGLGLGIAAGYFLLAFLFAPVPPLKPPTVAPQIVKGTSTTTTNPTPPDPNAPPAAVPAADPQAAFAASLKHLEETLAQSKKPNVDTEVSPAHREIEAWMVVKLVMLEHSPTIDPAWNKAANQKEKAFFQSEMAKPKSPDRAVMLAAFCLAGAAPDANSCASVDWIAAQDRLDELASLAAPAGKEKGATAPPKAATTPALTPPPAKAEDKKTPPEDQP